MTSASASSPPLEPPLAHHQSDADADEHAAQQRRQQRHAGQVGQHRREQVPQAEEQGHRCGRHDRQQDEPAAEEPPRQQVAGDVQHRRGDGRRDAEPVVEQEQHAEHAALGDIDALMDVMQSERGDGGAQHDEQDAPERQRFGDFPQHVVDLGPWHGYHVPCRCESKVIMLVGRTGHAGRHSSVARPPANVAGGRRARPVAGRAPDCRRRRRLRR